MGLQLTVISISNSTVVCTVWLPLEQKISSIIYNSSLNYLCWKGYILLVYDCAIWCLCCFSTHHHHYFTCLLPDCTDICKTLMKFGGFLLMLCPRLYMTISVVQVTLHYSESCWKSRCAQAAGTGRGHDELLCWFLVSSPVLCAVVLCCENPSVLLPFGSLMLADGNPAQLSKTLNNLLRTKLLGLRVPFSFSFSFSLCKLPFKTKVSNYRSGRQV